MLQAIIITYYQIVALTISMVSGHQVDCNFYFKEFEKNRLLNSYANLKLN